jgi:hypothetical protein
MFFLKKKTEATKLLNILFKNSFRLTWNSTKQMLSWMIFLFFVYRYFLNLKIYSPIFFILKVFLQEVKKFLLFFYIFNYFNILI